MINTTRFSVFGFYYFLGIIFFFQCSPKTKKKAPAIEENQSNRWSEPKANEWYARQAWLAGASFGPSNAISQLKMWQEVAIIPLKICFPYLKNIKLARTIGVLFPVRPTLSIPGTPGIRYMLMNRVCGTMILAERIRPISVIRS